MRHCRLAAALCASCICIATSSNREQLLGWCQFAAGFRGWHCGLWHG
jgi:hypothetical protein